MNAIATLNVLTWSTEENDWAISNQTTEQVSSVKQHVATLQSGRQFNLLTGESTFTPFSEPDFQYQLFRIDGPDFQFVVEG